MIDANKINEIVKNLVESLPSGLKSMPEDIERNFKSVLQSAFAKMDLVTREEFDAQTKVLLRTREKLEQIEQRLNNLEPK